jgi:nicotinate-nucleotide adenylyltransferase
MGDGFGRTASGRTPSRTAIFGGTFDPIHLGHLLVAEEVVSQFNYQRVVFVPARISPHKSSGPVVAVSDRLQMIHLALGRNERFELDRCEIDREGPSYTIDTVRHFLESGSVAGRPGLIVGADLVDAFETWREVDELELLVDIILVRRPGFDGAGLHRRHRTMENRELDVSSSELRRRISEGLPYQSLLPERVSEYIELNGLYR